LLATFAKIFANYFCQAHHYQHHPFKAALSLALKRPWLVRFFFSSWDEWGRVCWVYSEVVRAFLPVDVLGVAEAVSVPVVREVQDCHTNGCQNRSEIM